MSSANQNNSLLRTVTSLTLLGGIAASFAWACVSRCIEELTARASVACRRCEYYCAATGFRTNVRASNVQRSVGTASDKGCWISNQGKARHCAVIAPRAE